MDPYLAPRHALARERSLEERSREKDLSRDRRERFLYYRESYERERERERERKREREGGSRSRERERATSEGERESYERVHHKDVVRDRSMNVRAMCSHVMPTSLVSLSLS